MVQHNEKMTSPPETENGSGRVRRSWKRRVSFGLIYTAYVMVLAWAGIKAYWYIAFDVPITRNAEPDDVWRLYYPELWDSQAMNTGLSKEDGYIDVLLLGASVLEQTAPELEQQLQKLFGNRLRIYNLAKSAHTTRDSYHKFQRLRDKRFDLIIVYHGINDVRMNCCPPGEFRDDYTHCSWYASFQKRIKAKSLTFQGIVVNTSQVKIGLWASDQELLKFGNTIKTKTAFQTNVESIVKEAAKTSTPVLLMTFAYHIPGNYSRESFEKGELDYGDGHYQLAAELWGYPKNVTATIDAHNSVLHEIHQRHDNVLFIDQQRNVPSNGQQFSDPCHLTDTGIKTFVSQMLPVIKQKFRKP
jgi:lysophospholipase L1-like esterase